jgi:hypothetical protein
MPSINGVCGQKHQLPVFTPPPTTRSKPPKRSMRCLRSSSSWGLKVAVLLVLLLLLLPLPLVL